jgi:MFS family permease
MVFQFLYSQTADIFGRRWVYIFAVMVFTIGSAISGSAVNMSMFVFGRVE